jgi:hypothetical protein
MRRTRDCLAVVDGGWLSPIATHLGPMRLARYVSWRDSVVAGNRLNQRATAVSSWPGKIERTRLRTTSVTGLCGGLAVIVAAAGDGCLGW